jgi:4-amino-4-deoxy-L-arabinose transferase-like glycosyltransferase
MQTSPFTQKAEPREEERRLHPSAAWQGLPESRWAAPALLIFLSGFLFFYGLNAGELYRTESLRAIIAAEFLRSGNWIVPTLYGEPLLTKPPGMYAAIALVSWPFGQVTEWTARLPSALAAAVTVFLIYGYFRRQLGVRPALMAAVMLPVSVMWLDKATSAEIDMMEVAWVTAAILCFLRALEAVEADNDRALSRIISMRFTWRPRADRPLALVHAETDGQMMPGLRVAANSKSPNRRAAWLWWLAAMTCVAGGVLTKWTAPAFFYLTIVPFLWWRGRLGLLLGRQHCLSAAVAASLCLAWIGAAVAQTGWQPFLQTVGREAATHLLPSHHHRPYPWGETFLHPFKVMATSLPWSAVALLALRRGFAGQWDERGRRLLQALHCWVWPNLIFWSIIPGHSTRHSFPLFPGISGLAALVWIGWMGSTAARRPLFRPGPVLAIVLLIWLGAKIIFVEAVVPAREFHREPRAKGRTLAALIPEGQTLYLSKVKDEGIMFYYGRTVRRVPDFGQLPSSGEPLYCILNAAERSAWLGPVGVNLPQRENTGDFEKATRIGSRCANALAWLGGSGMSSRPVDILQEMNDEQGDPLVVVKLPGSRAP